MEGDFADAFGVLRGERLRDTLVQLANALARDRFDEHFGDLVVRERKAALASLVGRAKQSRQRRLGDRETDRRLASRARADEQPNVELTSDDRRGAKHRLRAR